MIIVQFYIIGTKWKDLNIAKKINSISLKNDVILLKNTQNIERVKTQAKIEKIKNMKAIRNLHLKFQVFIDSEPLGGIRNIINSFQKKK